LSVWWKTKQLLGCVFICNWLKKGKVWEESKFICSRLKKRRKPRVKLVTLKLCWVWKSR
jgi:hypothetical protein